MRGELSSTVLRGLAGSNARPATRSRLIVEQMRQKGWAYWDRLTGGEVAFQDMLAPALAALPEDDQAYFAEVATGESFEDLIDLFSASFTVT